MKYWGIFLIIAIVAFVAITSLQDDEKRAKQKSELINPQNKQPLYITLSELVGKTKESIAGIFGKPNRTNVTSDCAGYKSPCTEYYYKGDSIMIMYKNGKASYFDFEHLEMYSFNISMPSIFGFRPTEPEILNGQDVYWYKGLTRIKKASFIESKSQPGKISYAIFEAY